MQLRVALQTPGYPDSWLRQPPQFAIRTELLPMRQSAASLRQYGRALPIRFPERLMVFWFFSTCEKNQIYFMQIDGKFGNYI